MYDQKKSMAYGHAIKQRKKKGFSGRKITWDHMHQLRKMESYVFQSAGQLLEDFWKAVDQYLEG